MENNKEYCVTGGTGFIAAYLVKALLLAGHRVRATVRDPGDAEKVGYLWELKGAKERLKLVKADLLVAGSFDDAVRGVDGVFHTASPVLVQSETVKRVVLTSSCSSIRYRYDAQQLSPLNESHWSDLDYCKSYNLWYAFAKTTAEKEAWRTAQEQGIDLVVVNPSFVVGPLLAPQPTSTLLLILAIVKGLKGEIPNTSIGFVHIDDVVAAHILAMEDKSASGRLVCSSSVAHWSDVVTMLKDKYPDYPYETKLSSQEGDSNKHSMDTSKIGKLGLGKFRSLEEMFDECIKSFQEKGFL
ncbi:Tetraketide alpha-pyrone reductase 2 [Linum perenne]